MIALDLPIPPQAGIRAMGSLSVVDYPGYETAEAPDMETYSKALNGGQYPLSVLALQVRLNEQGTASPPTQSECVS